MKTRAIRMAASAAAVLTGSLVAQATDSKVYSPAFCKPWHSDDALDYGFSDGALVAHEDGAFFCPLIRDETGSSHGISAVWIEVFHPTNSLPSCYLYANEEDQAAGLVDWVWGDVVDGTPGFDQIVFDTNVGWPIETSDGDEGAYSVWCELEADMEIQQITVIENEN